MGEHPNVAMVSELMGAMDRGDVAFLEDHTSDDIVWHTGGNSRAAGTRRGKDEVRQMMSAVTSDSMKVQNHAILGDDGCSVPRTSRRPAAKAQNTTS